MWDLLDILGILCNMDDHLVGECCGYEGGGCSVCECYGVTVMSLKRVCCTVAIAKLLLCHVGLPPPP